ncbi:ABC transporter ATP-binding protein [Phytoactinopolyspora endophytica]|uniref:ABC transporter ATP-binding protein n=1 Tax=Phytoactinopolyspora endophytica TaxID=1642495 RepID=UPI001F0EDC43|nr:oligopeptide/dipeptide ABC transporter ATP-binding protein [Phytoactinopolyspora endophytica]
MVSLEMVPDSKIEPRPAPGQEVLRVEDLTVHFPVKSTILRRKLGEVSAVDGVSFSIAAGETLGLVGESGCGKSTTALAVLRLVEATDGHIFFNGKDLRTLGKGGLRHQRRNMQIVLQDPFSSLDPRMTVRSIVAEPLKVHHMHKKASDRNEHVNELLQLVGLDPALATRYPHEFSGGQRQRISIARALALDPKLLVLDEPVSSLDVSIQAQVVNLLEELQDRLSLAYLFVAHDLSVVKHICDRVAVMYLGHIVETGTADEVYNSPTHPYTQALLSAVPVPDPEQREHTHRIILKGDVPSPMDPPSGCRFRTRCWKAEERCAIETPELIDRFNHGHPSACHFANLPTPAPTADSTPKGWLG